jgi:hypothetical protein
MNHTQSPDPWPENRQFPPKRLPVNGRCAVLIPSRNRPDHLRAAIQSVLDTSRCADVLCYIDDDQAKMYGGLLEGERLIVHRGPRIGPAPAANTLVAAYPDYSAYGLITDDTTMVSGRWDEWLFSALASFPKRLVVVSPWHNLGGHVDMPFVSREWIDLLGFYACPDMIHYSWPILTGLIGEMTAIVHAPQDSFAVQHEGLEHTNQNVRDKDARAFFEYVSLKLPVYVERLRKELAA